MNWLRRLRHSIKLRLLAVFLLLVGANMIWKAMAS